MFLTPLLVYKAPHFTAGERALDPLAKLLRARSAEELEESTVGHSDHVVIIGYGLAGQFLTSSLNELQIEVVALEMNSDNVRKGKEMGDPVYYADATSEEALGHAHVESCRAIVIMINDHQATERVLSTIERMKVTAPVFVRTQFMRGSDKLSHQGRHEVVACEVEGGLEVLSRVLRKLEIPRNLISREINRARDKTMKSERDFSSTPLPLDQHTQLKKLKVETLQVNKESPVLGKTPKELDLADETGIQVVAISRNNELISHRLSDVCFEKDDIIYCIAQESDFLSSSELITG
jgi:CPA2 family monovalent cation:H+ antiporter-2